MTENRLNYDIAYGCFLFCGMAALIISSLSFIPIDPGILGFFVVMPLFMVSLVAMAIGIGYTIRLYHHWPLVVISLFSVLFVAEVVADYGSVVLPILYGISACVFSFAWFLVLRKRWGGKV